MTRRDASSSRAAPTTPTTSTTRPRIRPAGGRRPAVQRHRCGRPRGSVARAVALHCKSTAPGAATVRKEPYSRTLPGDRPVSFRRAGRSRPRAGRPRPAQRSIRMERRLVGLVRDVGVSPQRQRALDNASLARRRLQRCPTPRSDGGELLPLCKTTETRRCPTTRARPFRGRMDDCSYSLSRMRRSGTARCPRLLPGPRTCYRTRRAQKNATRTGARARQHDESPYTHGARAKRGPRASHTHYEHTTSATRRPAREKHTAHTPNSKMRPRAFRIRRARIAARAMAQPSD